MNISIVITQEEHYKFAQEIFKHFHTENIIIHFNRFVFNHPSSTSEVWLALVLTFFFDLIL